MNASTPPSECSAKRSWSAGHVRGSPLSADRACRPSRDVMQDAHAVGVDNTARGRAYRERGCPLRCSPSPPTAASQRRRPVRRPHP
eukprot:1119603-Rhodomonas_salina.1